MAMFNSFLYVYQAGYSLPPSYPLVMTHIANWNITMLLMGKSTISITIFNGFLYVYQAGYLDRKLI